MAGTFLFFDKLGIGPDGSRASGRVSLHRSAANVCRGELKGFGGSIFSQQTCFDSRSARCNHDDCNYLFHRFDHRPSRWVMFFTEPSKEDKNRFIQG